MAKAKREGLTKYRRAILSNYLEEMELVNGMAKVNFIKKKACSSCGEEGYVPEHHKYLCVFCWATASYFVEAHEDLHEKVRHGYSDKPGFDRVNLNMPVGIQGIYHDKTPSDIMIYNDKNFTQEELQAMIP